MIRSLHEKNAGTDGPVSSRTRPIAASIQSPLRPGEQWGYSFPSFARHLQQSTSSHHEREQCLEGRIRGGEREVPTHPRMDTCDILNDPYLSVFPKRPFAPQRRCAQRLILSISRCLTLWDTRKSPRSRARHLHFACGAGLDSHHGFMLAPSPRECDLRVARIACPCTFAWSTRRRQANLLGSFERERLSFASVDPRM